MILRPFWTIVWSKQVFFNGFGGALVIFLVPKGNFKQFYLRRSECTEKYYFLLRFLIKKRRRKSYQARPNIAIFILMELEWAESQNSVN